MCVLRCVAVQLASFYLFKPMNRSTKLKHGQSFFRRLLETFSELFLWKSRVHPILLTSTEGDSFVL
ncbi:MAG: hypothetical protein EBY81_02425 [Verrucomicrobia bacterium]|nr:hypothetical protein [Verrucomicrobiota bacterium]